MLNGKKFYIAVAAFTLLTGLGIIAPDLAFAFDPNKGADDALALMKKITLVIMLFSAAVSFLKHQMIPAVIIVIVGGIILAATSLSTLEAIGSGILKVIGG